MRTIYIVGAPGVGKTTLYEALQKRRNGAWLTPLEAEMQMVRKLSRGVFPTQSFFKVIASYIPLPRLQRIIAKNSPPYGKDAMQKKQREYEEFLRACIDCMQGSVGNSLRYFSVAGIPLYFLRDTVLRDIDGNTLMVSDGSRSQLQRWVAGALAWCDYAQGRRFFETMPLPTGVIHCKLATPKAHERLISRLRRGDLQNWWGMTESEVLTCSERCATIYEEGVDILTRRGVVVLELDMDSSSPRIIEEAERFIHRIR